MIYLWFESALFLYISFTLIFIFHLVILLFCLPYIYLFNYFLYFSWLPIFIFIGLWSKSREEFIWIFMHAFLKDFSCCLIFLLLGLLKDFIIAFMNWDILILRLVKEFLGFFTNFRLLS